MSPILGGLLALAAAAIIGIWSSFVQALKKSWMGTTFPYDFMPMAGGLQINILDANVWRFVAANRSQQCGKVHEEVVRQHCRAKGTGMPSCRLP